MPTAKQLAYDHPAYQVPHVFSDSTAAGANNATAKFAAFTAMQIRRVITAPQVASTSASTPLMYKKSGTATTTTTLSAISSAATAAVTNVLATAVSLAAGDQFWIAHGTDATLVASVSLECYADPGASLACP